MISPSSTAASMMGGMFGGEVTLNDHREALKRNLGGNNVANNVLIFPKSFEEKDAVTDYLDKWNDYEGALEVDGKNIAFADRTHVTYTDTLELVISVVNTMIDVITYALVAFTSISLVVSTVMIGIITYGKQFEMQLYVDDNHSIRKPANYEHLHKRIMLFLQNKL